MGVHLSTPLRALHDVFPQEYPRNSPSGAELTASLGHTYARTPVHGKHWNRREHRGRAGVRAWGRGGLSGVYWEGEGVSGGEREGLLFISVESGEWLFRVGGWTRLEVW